MRSFDDKEKKGAKIQKHQKMTSFMNGHKISLIWQSDISFQKYRVRIYKSFKNLYVKIGMSLGMCQNIEMNYFFDISKRILFKE